MKNIMILDDVRIGKTYQTPSGRWFVVVEIVADSVSFADVIDITGDCSENFAVVRHGRVRVWSMSQFRERCKPFTPFQYQR